MENNFVLIKWIKKLADEAYTGIDKLAKLLKTSHGKNIVKLLLQTIILLIFIRLLELPVMIISITGAQIFAAFASTFRVIFSSIWEFSVYYVYFLYVMVLVYSFIELTRKSKDLMKVSEKEESNKKFAETMEGFAKFFKAVIIMAQIPLVLAFIANIVLIIYMSIYAAKGVYLYSLFYLSITVFLFIILALWAINLNFVKKAKDKKNNLMIGLLSVAAALFLISMSVLVYETKNYNYKNQLTSDFSMMDSELSYSLASNEYEKIKIIAPRNINIIEDETINDKVMISVSRAETSGIETSTKIVGDDLNVEIAFELDFKFVHMKKISQLIIRCIEDKTIYDYTKLKYGDIQIRVNPNDVKRIEIVDRSND